MNVHVARVGGHILDRRNGSFTGRKDRQDHASNQMTAAVLPLTIGVIAAGAVVLAQPARGAQDEPERPARRAEIRRGRYRLNG